MTQPVHLADIATAYLQAGLCVLPARRDQKRPTVPWKPYQKRLPTENEVEAWFANNPTGLCLLTGAVSGNHEVIDFDQRGALFEAWCQKVRAAAPGLVERLVVSKTQNDGRHVSYRHQADACGNLKLAQLAADGKVVTLIETRGEGGLYLCAPTPGYEVIQGDLCGLPVLSEADRDVLLQCAWELNEHLPTVVDGPRTAANNADIGPCATHRPHIGGSLAEKADRPGDDFNNRGDVRAVLEQHGWRCVRGGENEYWCRPGKTCGTSATLKDRVFYVFSSNAAPFEPNRAYSPFAVCALLEHSGNYEQAARSLRLSGYGSDCAAESGAVVDLSAIVGRIEAAPVDTAAQEPENPTPADPGPLPDELLRMPGFVGELMDFSLATAPYPNPTMAFCGALAAQSFLAGRKVRDPGDNRTNLYLLGLAFSSAGKEHPRRVNTRLLWEVGLGHCVGDKFASGEGVQDALLLSPAMLFQTDEIDGMLQAINKSRDGRQESLMGTLLTMYTSSASVYPMRRKAGKEHPGSIDQPSLTVFGTAVPTHYYEALSSRMLTNGFFARMIVLEAGSRGEGQEPAIRDLPPRLIETAKWWADFQPGERRGNLLDIHPIPAIVEQTDEAKALLVETRLAAEETYTQAEGGRDEVGTTVWGRVSENVRKLALIYAISENHQSPLISREAVAWARRFVEHQTRRMLFMASQHVADGEFDADCLKLTRKLREAEGQALEHSKLLKRMKMDSRTFLELITTLVQRGDVEIVSSGTAGRPSTRYRLRVKEVGA